MFLTTFNCFWLHLTNKWLCLVVYFYAIINCAAVILLLLSVLLVLDTEKPYLILLLVNYNFVVYWCCCRLITSRVCNTVNLVQTLFHSLDIRLARVRTIVRFAPSCHRGGLTPHNWRLDQLRLFNCIILFTFGFSIMVSCPMSIVAVSCVELKVAQVEVLGVRCWSLCWIVFLWCSLPDYVANWVSI